MNNNLNWQDARPTGCSVCGKILKEGEMYVENNGTVVCAACTEELDLCDILELLEVPDVLTLFLKRTDCVKTAL